MSKPHYIIRRERDRRLIAGAFVDIRSLEMAERIRLEWQANYPNDAFLVETV
jgi:hypothetical protein